MSSKSNVIFPYGNDPKMNGIRLVGSPEGAQYLTSALDTLRERSKVADEIISRCSYLNMAKNDKLCIVHGPQRNPFPCTCGRCLKALVNAFHGELNIVIHTPETFMYDGSEPWMNIPPELCLGHELVHALHRASGDYNQFDDRIEEHRTVGINEFAKEQFSENAIRRDYGLPMRPYY